MNCKRSLYAAAMVLVSFAAPAPGFSQTPPAAAVGPAAPARNDSQISARIVRVVNDASISTLDIRQQMKWLSVTTGIQPTAQTLPLLQQQALEDLTDEHLKYQELKRRQEMYPDAEMFVSDKEVDDLLTKLAKQNDITLEQFLADMDRIGVGAARLRQQYKVSLSWDQFFQQFYGRKVRITQADVKAVQDQISAAAASPRYHLFEIFIEAARAGGVSQAVNAANQILTQLQQGAPFEGMARQYSGKPTAATGGDAGWVNASDLPPAVAEALAPLRAGQIARPIAVDNGAYIYLLQEKSAGGGASIVTLKQAAVALGADSSSAAAAAAQQQLLALKAKSPTCATLDRLASGMAGVEVDDLGETEVSDLSPTFRTAVENLPVDQISDPVRTNMGLHLIAVCGRRAAGANIPAVEEIENQLYGERMEMLQRRELRNLRAAATISSLQ